MVGKTIHNNCSENYNIRLSLWLNFTFICKTGGFPFHSDPLIGDCWKNYFFSIFASLIGSNLSEATWYLELPVSWDRKVAWFAELVCLYFEHVWWYVLLIRYLLYFGNVLMLNTEYKYPDRGQPINQRILCCFSTMLGEFWFFMYGIYFMYRIFMFVPKFLCASFERLDLGCKDSSVEHFVIYISWSCELLL